MGRAENDLQYADRDLEFLKSILLQLFNSKCRLLPIPKLNFTSPFHAKPINDSNVFIR